MVTGVVKEYKYNNPYHRYPLELSHYIGIPDRDNMNQTFNFDYVFPKRQDIILPGKGYKGKY